MEIACCYRQLARLHYMMSEHAEAINTQLKAVILTERCLGLLLWNLLVVCRIVIFCNLIMWLFCSVVYLLKKLV